MTATETLTPPKPVPARPYARRKKSEISVTTAIDLLGKPGLVWGATKEAALFAVHHTDQWLGLRPEEAVDTIRRHHQGLWNSRAAIGTAVHTVNELWGNGKQAELPEIIEHLIANESNAKGWRGREAEILAEIAGNVDGLERFWTDFQPTAHVMEEIVRTPDLYIGTSDWRCLINGVWWRLDIKTTGQQDADKGIYHDSWALQLAAYERAIHRVRYAWKGPKLEIVESWPNECTERQGVVHLRGGGHYDLLEVKADDDAYNRFVELVAIAKWKKGLSLPVRVQVPEGKVA